MIAQHVNRAHVGTLAQMLTEVADSRSHLADRREALLLMLAEAVGADVGHWAWGRGSPERQNLIVVANIPYGYDDARLRQVMAFGMSETGFREFHLPQMSLLRDGMISAIRQDIISDKHWSAEHPLRQSLAGCDVSSFLNVVRYSQQETWSQLLFFRNLDRPEFQRAELELINLAMSTVPWLWATADESLAQTPTPGLTPRQRAVLLHLLSGLSRKMIAHRLRIQEVTVNDHVKAIFAHFQVNSMPELAAIFLKSR